MRPEILTGDLFVIHLEWSTQLLTATKPKEWLFNLRDPLATFADLNEATSMREVVGRPNRSAEALTTTRSQRDPGRRAATPLQEHCKLYQLPIGIDQVIHLQDVRPPDCIKAAFTEVNGAMPRKRRPPSTPL